MKVYKMAYKHLTIGEGDSIIGKDHKSAVITLVEKLSKVIITIYHKGKTAKDV